MDSGLTGHPNVQHIDDIVISYGNFFVVERAIADGSLPDPSAEWADHGWIDTYHWDFLVYANSAAPLMTGRFHSGWDAANNYCGMNTFDRGEGLVQRRRRRLRELMPRLLQSGLVAKVGRIRADELMVYELRLAPSRSARSERLRHSQNPRTGACLKAENRPYFTMPMNLFMKNGVWKHLEHHEHRRVLAALYAYADLTSFGGVDPNHLCLRGDTIEMSEAFRLACGADRTVDDICGSLAVLHGRSPHLLVPVMARLDEGRPHPGQQSGVRFATLLRQGEPSTDTSVFMLPYTTAGEEEQ